LFQHEAVPPAVEAAAEAEAAEARAEAEAEAPAVEAEREPTYDDIINRVMREWRNSAYVSSDSESDSAIDLT
jgi:regulator of protease activity HflC (stomatin/prohibitin superfamily)